jgi:hypothetical protein
MVQVPKVNVPVTTAAQALIDRGEAPVELVPCGHIVASGVFVLRALMVAHWPDQTNE